MVRPTDEKHGLLDGSLGRFLCVTWLVTYHRTPLFYGDTLINGVWCPYMIVEFIVVCHKSKFTKKYKGCQIKVLKLNI